MLLILAAPAVAAPVWPTSNSSWTALTQGSQGYADSADTVLDNNSDIRGSTSLSAGYYYFDDSQNLLMFRIRINRAPYNWFTTTWSSNVWQVLFDTDGTQSTIDWALQLDQATASARNRVEFGAVTHGSPDTWSNLSISDTTWNNSNMFRTVATGETQFNWIADYFIDLAIPYKVFADATGLGKGSTFSVALTTSTSHSTVNVDTPDGLNPGAGPFSNSITFNPAVVPEPSTLLLMGTGLFGLLALHRRRFRRELPSAGTRGAESARRAGNPEGQ